MSVVFSLKNLFGKKPSDEADPSVTQELSLGTPEPSTVGKTQSHGCVRLTNWDALKLAGMVKPGTKVVFQQ